MFQRAYVAIAGLLVLGMPAMVLAEPYKVTFSGKVAASTSTYSEIRDVRSIFGSVGAGDEFTATYYYDREKLSTMTAQAPFSPGQFWYPFTGSDLTINGNTLSLSSSFYQVLGYSNYTDWRGRESQSVSFLYNMYPAGEILSVGISINSLNGDLFTSRERAGGSFLTAGPSAFDLVKYDYPFQQSGSVWGNSANGGNSFLSFSLTPERVTVSAVPEPATWAMMLIGFGMISATARYRRRSEKVTYA